MERQIILIDDEEIVRQTWEMAAEIIDKPIITYASISEFEGQINAIAKDSEIYIDSKLGNDEDDKGEVLAKKLYNQGFQNLYITTGYEEYDFKDMPWLKKVVDKEPPF